MNFIYFTSIILIGLYLLICLLLYLFQEKLIFYPTQLKTDHTFKFSGNFNEIFFKTKDGKSLNALLFKAKKPKGVIFYLHGNAASLDHWGNVAETYTELNYDVFIWDYRGYGKSDGKILSEEQLLEDAQLAYDQLKNNYVYMIDSYEMYEVQVRTTSGECRSHVEVQDAAESDATNAM